MSIAGFLGQVGELKRVQRTGWVLRGIANAESVADHSFRVAIMALCLATECGVKREKAVRMALVHDLAEAITGDINHGSMPKKQKHALEKKALEKMGAGLPPKVAREIMLLWEEYAAAKTPEARFVKDVDKLELAMQAAEYEKRQQAKHLGEFFAYAKKEIKHEKLRKLLAAVMNNRN